MTAEEKRNLFEELLDARLNGDRSRDAELDALAAPDPDLRTRLAAAATIAGGLAEMRDVDPGPAFSANVKKALRHTPRLVPVAASRRAGRPVMLQAAAAVALAVAGLVAGFFIGRGSTPQATTRAAAVATPQSTVPVKFLFHAPAAGKVSVIGNFNDWNEGAHTLMKSANGWWTLEIAFPPGRYNYVFLVDGEKWETDPSATLVEDDGFGRRNSVLDI